MTRAWRDSFERFLRAWRTTVGGIVRADVAMFRKQPRLAVMALGALAIPVLYAVLYLSSVWDPYGRIHDLPVAIVVVDRGTHVEAREVRLGDEVFRGLERSGRVHLVRYAHEADATSAVRRGEAAFAVLLGEDFSERAVHPNGAAAAVRVYVSEGNSSTAAMIARRFAADVARQANDALARERWRAVLTRVDESGSQLTRLRDAVGAIDDGTHRVDDGLARAASGGHELANGLHRAHAGSAALANGSARVGEGTTRLVRGVEQLGDGLRTMQSRLPADTDLARLTNGADAVASGARRLADGNARIAAGASQLAEGNARLAAGSRELRHGLARIPIWGGRAADGASRLERGADALTAGARRLATGTAEAVRGSERLADGAMQLDDAVARVADGTRQLHRGVDRMVDALPPSARLDELADGGRRVATGTQRLGEGLARLDDGGSRLADGLDRLHDGSTRLAAGVSQLHAALPAAAPRLEGTPESLAVSIESTVITAAPVANNGIGFVPYFTPVALWVGAVMCAFLFHLRRVPQSLVRGPRSAIWIGKLVVPSTLVTLQAIAVAGALRYGLHVPVANVWQFTLTLVLASLVFVRIVVLLQRWLGDSGKGVALLVLVVQLAAAGGPYPIELAPRAFRTIHPYLPFTQVLTSLRAALFGAYDGRWHVPMLRLAMMGAFVIVAGIFVGRWRSVDDGNYGPAVEV